MLLADISQVMDLIIIDPIEDERLQGCFYQLTLESLNSYNINAMPYEGIGFHMDSRKACPTNPAPIHEDGWLLREGILYLATAREAVVPVKVGPGLSPLENEFGYQGSPAWIRKSFIPWIQLDESFSVLGVFAHNAGLMTWGQAKPTLILSVTRMAKIYPGDTFAKIAFMRTG